MIRRTAMGVFVLAAVAACTADPDAPINQTAPIRQMDDFARSLRGEPPPRAQRQEPVEAPAYTRDPGYAPAYPPYEGRL